MTTAATQLNLSPNRTPLIAVASGKGGVGKTSITLNLARALAKAGKRVLVFDADLGLANIDVQLGLTTEKDLSLVLRGEATLADVVTRTQAGFDVIAGRNGSEDLPFTTALDRRSILNDLRTLSSRYDLVLIDVAAGVNDEVLIFAKAADRTLLVVTPDPSSITDAYAVIKLLKLRHDTTNCDILINQSGTELDGKQTYARLATATEKFLGFKPPLKGVLPHDKQYAQAVRLQQLVLDAFPAAKASETLTTLAKSLLAR